MTRAIEMGADVVGGIPHYENTRDKGVSSVMFLMDLAQRPPRWMSTAMKSTIRSRVSSKCWRKRRGCGGAQVSPHLRDGLLR